MINPSNSIFKIINVKEILNKKFVSFLGFYKIKNKETIEKPLKYKSNL